MREWSIKLNNDLHKVAMLADGEATWHARLGEWEGGGVQGEGKGWGTGAGGTRQRRG
jgi:hypothetical protein